MVEVTITRRSMNGSEYSATVKQGEFDTFETFVEWSEKANELVDRLMYGPPCAPPGSKTSKRKARK